MNTMHHRTLIAQLTQDAISILERLPDEWTVERILSMHDDITEDAQEQGVKCAHENCQRLITKIRDNYWTHISPEGKTSRTCKSASYDSPRAGDENKLAEWYHWPSVNYGQTARPPRKR